MLKKLRSNVPPDATIMKEIRKEFKPYFDKAEQSGTGFIKQHPRQIFIVMIIMIIVSLVLCFLILTPERRKKEIPEIRDTTSVQQSIVGGLGDIVETGNAVKDIYDLKKQVELILAKPKLTKADSAFLEKAIIELENQNKNLRAKQ